MATETMTQTTTTSAGAGAGAAPLRASLRRAYVPAIYNARKWSRFLDRCLATRLDVQRFAQFVSFQQRKHPVSPAVLADLLLRPRVSLSTTAASKPTTCHTFIDPRIPAYLQVLLQQKLVDVTSVLQALYRYSTSQRATRKPTTNQRPHDIPSPAIKMEDGQNNNNNSNNNNAEGGGRGKTSASPVVWANSYANEETTFYRLSRAVSQGMAIQSTRDALLVAKGMAAWMDLFVAAATAAAAEAAAVGSGAVVIGAAAGRDMTAQEQMQEEMGAARAAFVMLLLAVCENEALREALALPEARSVRRGLSASIGGFVPVISLTPTPITARLEQFRSETLASVDEPINGTADRNAKREHEEDIHDLLDSTVGLQNLVLPEMPIANSRAGLYIYLNACLVGRPLIDDTALFTYLHNRYQGDLQTTAIDLILASFDVLANAVFRTEGHTSAHLLRSFLLNKVPLLLASLASSPLYAFNSEYCISEALSRVDTNAFPTMSSMFDDSQTTTPLTDGVRQKFCFACCLHGLIAESSIETLLGEITYETLPAGGRFSKERLVLQCLSNNGGVHVDQITGLVGQLETMDGNAGAVCQALVAVLGQLCARRETTALKGLCDQLVRKPLAFDVILLFEKASAVVWPLCQLLDTWRYDDDMGGSAECQPIYEEFGAAVFLLEAFVHRYGLTVADLGVQWAADSFVARLLTTGHLARPLAEISEQERESLGRWIHGLFDTDAGGLSDELMSLCPPQQFYLLAPTLFQQIVQAVSSGVLSEETLKCGIDYLVDTFLLPSLVTALLYLSDALRVERPTEQRAIVRVLHLVLQPATISNDATQMLSALLDVVARPLEQSLRVYQRLDPGSQEVDPLLRVLKQNMPRSRRTGAAEHHELTFANTNHHDGLAPALRQTIQGFVQWSLHPGVHIMPTWYTHRQFLAGLALLGAPRLLQLVLDELQHQVDAGSGNIAFDVACALVCAPDAANEPSPEMLYVVGSEGTDDDESGHGNGNGHGGGDHKPPSPTGPHLVPNPATVQRRLSLRQALAFRAADWKQLQRSRNPADVALAETIVRLYRKVEAQMAPPPQVVAPTAPGVVDLTGGLAGSLAGDLSGDLTGNMGLDDNDAAAAAAALDDAAMEDIAAAAAVAAAADASDVMTLDHRLVGGGGGGGGDNNTGAGGNGTATTDAGAAGSVTASGDHLEDLGGLGDLGSLGSLEGLGDMDMGGGSGAGSMDLGDQSMFADLDLLNSWIDMQ